MTDISFNLSQIIDIEAYKLSQSRQQFEKKPSGTHGNSQNSCHNY